MKRLHPRLTYAKAAPILTIFAVFSALLVFAATAAAETRTGESTTPFIEGAPAAEATIVKGAASFETATGHVVFDITTAAEPQMTSSGEILAGLTTSECSPPTSLEGILPQLIFSSPLFVVESPFESPLAQAITGSSSTPVPVPASKSISGTTTTLSATSGSLVEAGFKCAVILMLGEGGSAMTFPIKAPPPPPPVTAPATVPTPAPAPPTAPAVLSIAKPKPLKAKVGKWKTVHVKVKNTGATATAQGSLRVKAAKGVLVKPEVQKLPVLNPGSTFTLSVRVQLSGKAKKKSTLAVTGTAPGVTGKSSIVLKLES